MARGGRSREVRRRRAHQRRHSLRRRSRASSACSPRFSRALRLEAVSEIRRQAPHRARAQPRVDHARAGRTARALGCAARDMHAISAETSAHLAELHDDLRASSASCGSVVGFHPFARQEDLPWVPKAPLRDHARVSADQTRLAFARHDAAHGHRAGQLRLRFRRRRHAQAAGRAPAVGPIVTAMFANSPFYERQHHRRQSERAKVWLAVDPDSPRASALRCGVRRAASATTSNGRSMLRCSCSSAAAR